jgi:hypothetical protein
LISAPFGAIGEILTMCRPQSGPKKSPILSKIPIPTHENIYTVPNILTFSRLVAAPLVGYFLVHDHHAAALSLFVYAGLTDLVDGYIARRYNLQTVVGTIIDPMADKLLMTIGVACLAVNGSIPGRTPSFNDAVLVVPSNIEQRDLPISSWRSLTGNSMACGNHSRSRCWSCVVRNLLSLDISPPPKDHGTILGFLPSLCGSQANGYLQSQHSFAACACGFCNRIACDSRGIPRRMESSRRNDGVAVSTTESFSFPSLSLSPLFLLKDGRQREVPAHMVAVR